ncbi:hypothetical protein V1512DRAFT_203037 [Lipomyces arxii]|uniref:uncharacterized protein n=1 Tax=Lipomyces arxii TaxID=56418 RepID=UPI0034CD1A73
MLPLAHWQRLLAGNGAKGPRQQVAVVTGLLCIVLWLLAIKSRQNNTQSEKEAPLILSPIPTFRHVTVYRRAPDVIYENFLDSVLITLKQSYSGTYNAEVWPNKIFQTAKYVDKQYAEAVQSWTLYNSEFEHILMDDKSAKTFVEEAFQSTPQLVQIYNTFPNPVIKADLLRYLLLYLYGGVYADIDVYCRKPVDQWVPKSIWDSKADVIVGIELDEPFATAESQRLRGWHRPFGFAQYTIVARPFAKPVRTAIVRVVAHAYHLARLKGKQSPAKLSKYSAEDIYEVSGPGVWTDALVDSMNYKKNDVSWAQFHDIKEPVSMSTEGGMIVVLPIQYFGNGQKHSNAGGYDQPEACVTHMFTKSWKRNSWFV